jgi:hypothetical protein
MRHVKKQLNLSKRNNTQPNPLSSCYAGTDNFGSPAEPNLRAHRKKSPIGCKNNAPLRDSRAALDL